MALAFTLDDIRAEVGSLEESGTKREILRLLDVAEREAEDMGGEIDSLESELEDARGKPFDVPGAAEALADWARGEDPRSVERVVEAIKAGNPREALRAVGQT